MTMDIRPAGKEVVEDQSDLDLEAAAGAVLVDGQQDLHRFHELRQVFQQPCSIAQRLANQADMERLEISQAAVNHLGGGGRSLGAAASLLKERNVVSLPGKLPSHTGPVDSPTNHRDSHAGVRASVRSGFHDQ